jgi:N-methylhydantoinase B/oxoprolinase/acetone carboxylase alpha subunit
MFDRVDNPPLGRDGGGVGQPGLVRLASGRPFRSKGLQVVASGDSLVMELPGGAGYGRATDRDRGAVERDLRLGYVSPDQARDLYDYNA